MDRTGSRSVSSRCVSLSAALVLASALASLAGCNLLALALYTVAPEDIPAEFDQLKDKRVVVVCRPVVELQFANSSAPSELTQQVCALLEKKVRSIKLVDQREVSEWTDENSWHNFSEVGKALKADMVVGVDLERFSLYQGATLFQGNAAVQVSVHDMQNGGRQVYQKTLPRVLYPPHMPISTADKSEAEFRRQFLGVLAEQIARNFYAHDSRVDFATDANL